jgi:hypothetical protein
MEEEALIRRSRGRFLILSRVGLEEATCECYRAIRAEHDRLFPSSATDGGLKGTESSEVDWGRRFADEKACLLGP